MFTRQFGGKRAPHTKLYNRIGSKFQPAYEVDRKTNISKSIHPIKQPNRNSNQKFISYPIHISNSYNIKFIPLSIVWYFTMQVIALQNVYKGSQHGSDPMWTGWLFHITVIPHLTIQTTNYCIQQRLILTVASSNSTHNTTRRCC